jgi:putative ABC transport system permease protein
MSQPSFFIRLLLRQKMYHAICISGLVGAMTVFFFIAIYIRFELSFDDYHTNIDRLYRVAHMSARTPVPLAEAMRTRVAGVESSARMIYTTSGSRFIVRDVDGELYEENGYYVDSTFLDLFTFTFLTPRPAKIFAARDEVIITRRLADKLFPNRQPHQPLTMEFANSYLTNPHYRVIAIIEDLPANTQLQFDLLIPYELHGTARYQSWTEMLVFTFALLEPGASPAVVQDEVRKLIQSEGKWSDADRDAIVLQPFRDLHFMFSNTFDFGTHNNMSTILILAGAGVLILLIAVINFVNLATARAGDRMKEVALRKVVGAGQWTLILQFMKEGLAIVTIAAILSAALVYAVMPGFESITGIRIGESMHVVRILLKWLPLFVLVVGMAASVYPAIKLASLKPVLALKGAAAPTDRAPNMRSTLVVLQFCVTAFLIIGTGVMVNQMDYIRNKDLGYQKEHVLFLNVGGPGIRERIHVAREEFLKHDGVVNVSGALTLPGDHTYTMPYSIHNSIVPDEETSLAGYYVDHQFLRNMDVELIAGRLFDPAVATDTINFILNETAVRELVNRYGAEWNNPVGRRLNYFRSGNSGYYVAKAGEVIGVVKDFNFASLYRAVEPLVIQVDYNLLYKLTVKIKPTHVGETLAFLEKKWKEIGMVRPFNYQFLDDRIAAQYDRDQKLESLFRAFAAVSIFISCIGLYGLVLYTTERRTREVSIRKVLGADVADLMLLLGRSFFGWVALAFLIVSPPTWWAAQLWLQQFAYRQDVGVVLFIQSAVICLLVAAGTVFFRIRKVSMTNPVRWLRGD